MEREASLRNDIVEVGRRIWLRGYVAANDGNISARVSRNEILATPTGVSKGFLAPEMLVKVDMEGRPLEQGGLPSSEILLHLEIYRAREDVCGVVHAHPPTCTGFAVAGLSLESPVLPEVIVSLKAIPLTEYGTPATEELPQAIRPYLTKYDAFLLANHGALTVGRDVYEAYYRMETVEHFASISLTARLLGRERTLPPYQVEKLVRLREKMGLGERTSCLECGLCEARESHQRFMASCESPVPPALGPGRRCILARDEDEPKGSEDLREMITRITREVLRRLER